MKDQLLELEERAIEEIEAVHDLSELEKFRIKYLGKKGQVTSFMKNVGGLAPEERPKIGKLANLVKTNLSQRFQEAKKTLISGKGDRAELFDATLPGREPLRGHLHPITLVIKEVCQIFSRMGFRVVKGPNVELDYYNFEALNIPKDHPARDMQDTFYISDNVVLRTHTSPIQVRVMETRKPPVSVIAPGKVYRRDSDVSHTPMFHQVEGLLVDRDVSFGDLKGTLTSFVHQMFGGDTRLRFRPSFFPFTEPSAEVDILCVICGGKGCRTCAHTGWLEILGSGMVDPEVYRFVDYDADIYSGFAFGMGIERIAMLKYGIDDIQLFFKNDMQFLRQF
ncbi:MAG: phenylalanine--tRNA ligase subunit alpha [Proteobacteria bacterium]|jgi:phenylalanyl-tRNA synthetase alpha chain|nr:phenylalanine--tRNA ligase subunit alpha [Desulfobacterales bacterium]MBL6968087.1 phenylalanine--tRNA ligase subunit alpha [Desulfobacteraceae bacterium]MBU0734121.1 phenylalanine--tRNA ligase subunit alpha [Pseudomonadota bacterium]MBU0989451.1 phenylalanine--tRNA ligase subunit alpha [Pseudomonadota bacterium]MBU1905350.1 phenylalanine--tRNA ligase subunit alpha [Pseudomonadota bacterium]